MAPGNTSKSKTGGKAKARISGGPAGPRPAERSDRGGREGPQGPAGGMSRGSRTLLKDVDITLRDARKNVRSISREVAKELEDLQKAATGRRPAPVAPLTEPRKNLRPRSPPRRRPPRASRPPEARRPQGRRRAQEEAAASLALGIDRKTTKYRPRATSTGAGDASKNQAARQEGKPRRSVVAPDGSPWSRRRKGASLPRSLWSCRVPSRPPIDPRADDHPSLGAVRGRALARSGGGARSHGRASEHRASPGAWCGT